MTRFEYYVMRIKDGDLAALEDAVTDPGITPGQYSELWRIARAVA